jgi:tetratricopeptide (TPR) repeat protein
MTQASTPVDFDAATAAVKSGQSLAEHLGLTKRTSGALYAAAVGHHEAGRYAQAIECLMQVTVLDARMPDAWALMGNSLMREGKFPEALEAWCLALHLNPSFASAHQVTRTAIALKDPPNAAIGLVAMFKHAETPEQRTICSELGSRLRVLVDGAPAPTQGA